MRWPLCSRRRRDAELAEELRAHLAMAVADRVARGESPEEAERAARREFGNRTLVAEVTREMWPGAWLEQLGQDGRYALRGLRRAPGFAVVAIITLALGIGANTAIFSVVNGVLLRPLPYPEPARLVWIGSQFPSLGFDEFWVDRAEFLEFREMNRSFEEVGAFTAGAVNIGGAAGRPERVPSAAVSPSLFPALGVAPYAGRTFTEAEGLPDAAPVAVLSYELWQGTFGGDRALIGRTIEVDGRQATVLGIMPPGFDIHDNGVQIWVPVPIDPAKRQDYRGSHFLHLVGRLRPGVSLERARSELDVLLAEWKARVGGTPSATPGEPSHVHAPTADGHRLVYVDLQSHVVGGVRTALWVLQAAVLLVLLIACANMANLLLMRAESRQREIAVRSALGAGRGRLMRQFIAEGLVLAVGGGAVGLLLASAGIRALVGANDGSIPRAASIGLDPAVLAFTLALVLGTGVLFGFAPLLRLRSRSVSATLRGGDARASADAAPTHVRNGLVVAEMAFAVMLVIGAGLLIRSVHNLLTVDAGFDRSRLTTFNLVLPAATYSDSTRVMGLFDQLTVRLAALPGVQSAAAMTGLPPQRRVNANDTEFEGYTPVPGGPPENVDYYQVVTPNYLETMGIPLVAGRSFRPSDDGASSPVAMVNETLARLYYPRGDAVGRRLRPSGATDTWFTIVGVVKDVKQGGLGSKTGTELYLNLDQLPAHAGFVPRNMHLVLRSALPTSAMAGSIRREVAALDPTLPVAKLRSMDEVFSDSVSRPRLLARLLGLFAAVALVLAAVGIYGVLAYAVTARRRELGIRLALGAEPNGLVAMVLRRGMRLAGIGLVAGLLGALAATRLADSLLFGVRPADPATFAGVAAFMAVVALAACVVPARRATRVDPVMVLRGE